MIEISHGSTSPLGPSFRDGQWNFAIYSAHAKAIAIGLFAPGANSSPFQLYPLNKTGNIWHISLKNLPPNSLYAYQCEGDWNEQAGDLYNEKKWLLDPYAKILESSPRWNHGPLPYLLAHVQTIPPFDWKNTKQPKQPKEDLVIYEMHIRGFTAACSSRKKGTFAGAIEKIPYLKELGITAVEFMPIYEFDECQTAKIDPKTGKKLPNYWGYNSLSFFAPKRNYAYDPNGAITECKTLIRELHKNGIQVILDVVYNHTGEGKEKDYAISWRGIDNRTYYLLHPDGSYNDYTGCGNTINANDPAVMQQILDSLRFWVEEMHVDGFRFDLCSVLSRGPNGEPLNPSPVLKAISTDPVLSGVHLISESWDAAGLYQLGSFPKWGAWHEWNGRYRDIARRFLKGTDGKAGHFASALSGSEFLYKCSSPLSSINFITSHDGFCLRDLVTYQEKHNWENGEENRDGMNQNDNWNCGAEGTTSDPSIQALRERQMRNHWLALFLSQGVPMILMGDEYGHTRKGNNNPYSQDNEVNWFLWEELKQNPNIFSFVRDLIAFYKSHPELRRDKFYTSSDIAWHGIRPGEPDWSEKSRFVAFSLPSGLYAAFNANFTPASVELPKGSWHLVVNTADGWEQQWFTKKGPTLSSHIELAPYSALLAKSN